MKLDLNRQLGARREITNRNARDIRRLYTDAAASVAEDLASLQGDTTTSGRMRQGYLRDLGRQLNAELQKIGNTVQTTIQTSMFDVATAVTQTHTGFAIDIGMSVGAAFSHVPTNVVNLVTSGRIYDRPWALSNAIWQHTRADQSTINRIIADGIARNRSAYDIARDLERFVNPDKRKPWDWSRVYPGSGRQIDYNAQRLARTMVSHAYRVANDQCLAPNPFCDAEQWTTSNSHRVCSYCQNIANTDEYDLGEGVFPKGEAPMDHPNGMCVLIPIIPYDMDDIGGRIADWFNRTESDNDLGVSDSDLDAYAAALR